MTINEIEFHVTNINYVLTRAALNKKVRTIDVENANISLRALEAAAKKSAEPELKQTLPEFEIRYWYHNEYFTSKVPGVDEAAAVAELKLTLNKPHLEIASIHALLL